MHRQSKSVQTSHSNYVFTGDLKHWEKVVPQEETKNPWLSQPNSVNVEITAYALLTLVNNNQITDGLPIMKWLLSQQNENGGFQSTQVRMSKCINWG